MKKNALNINQTVLVLGGRGFIGRHVAKYLTLLGANVLLGSRFEIKGKRDNIRQIKLHQKNTTQDLRKALENIDVVVNTVGILRQRYKESYDVVQNQAVKRLAEVCKQQGVRFVHVSALGLDNPLKSRFTQSKLLGEKHLINSDVNWAIVRPSLVDGKGGYGARWFQRVAKLPIHFLQSNATGKFAPIDIDDLGEAIARVALLKQQEPCQKNRIYELGGNQQLDLAEYLTRLNPAKKPIMRVQIPALVARIVSHVMDCLYLTPYSFGHYELLKFDNLPAVNRLEEVLGRTARLVEGKYHKKNQQIKLSLRHVSQR